MKKQQGFTLIELMIVVAIIGILAAIAIPAYQDYIIRSKVTELVTAADACKTSVAEYYQSQNAFPADITVAGCRATGTDFMTSLGYDGTTHAITATGSAAVKSTNIVLTPSENSGGLKWACSTQDDAHKKYVPANCRG